MENFKLEALTLLDKGGMAFEYTQALVEDDHTHLKRFKINATMPRSQEIDEAMNTLRYILSENFGFTTVVMEMVQRTNPKDKALKTVALQLKRELDEKVKVTQFSLGGNENRKTIVIRGSKVGFYKRNVSLVSQKILLNAGEMPDIEEQIETSLELLNELVYKYWFEQTRSQMSLWESKEEEVEFLEEAGD